MNTTKQNQDIRSYIDSNFAKEDELLRQVREKGSAAFQVPGQEIPPYVGKLLYLFVKLRAPKRVLEIGTLCGYSTLWLAKGLSPSSRIISLEQQPLFVERARANIAHAGLTNQVEIRLGKAVESLSTMLKNQEGPFDLILIDADKKNYAAYLEYAVSLAAPGALLLIDNLIPRESEVGSPNPEDAQSCAVYEFNQILSAHPRLDCVLLPTLAGERGRIDALGIAILN
ncbi:MAG: O-methyltransferase [Chlamydiae bacterium]|nr:O-methyltransferase [Chlamydiota bacterium]